MLYTEVVSRGRLLPQQLCQWHTPSTLHRFSAELMKLSNPYKSWESAAWQQQRGVQQRPSFLQESVFYELCEVTQSTTTSPHLTPSPNHAVKSFELVWHAALWRSSHQNHCWWNMLLQLLHKPLHALLWPSEERGRTFAKEAGYHLTYKGCSHCEVSSIHTWSRYTVPTATVFK